MLEKLGKCVHRPLHFADAEGEREQTMSAFDLWRSAALVCLVGGLLGVGFGLPLSFIRWRVGVPLLLGSLGLVAVSVVIGHDLMFIPPRWLPFRMPEQ